jgi:hypothetical protein
MDRAGLAHRAPRCAGHRPHAEGAAHPSPGSRGAPRSGQAGPRRRRTDRVRRKPPTRVVMVRPLWSSASLRRWHSGPSRMTGVMVEARSANRSSDGPFDTATGVRSRGNRSGNGGDPPARAAAVGPPPFDPARPRGEAGPRPGRTGRPPPPDRTVESCRVPARRPLFRYPDPGRAPLFRSSNRLLDDRSTGHRADRPAKGGACSGWAE